MIKKAICIAVGLSILTGCVSLVSGSKGVENRGMNELDEGKALGREPDFSRLRYSDRYFVPELSAEVEDKPEWWFEPVRASIIEMPLQGAMQEFLSPLGVNARYLDGINGNYLVGGIIHDGTVGELIEKLAFATQFSYDITRNSVSWSRFQTETVPVRARLATPSFNVGSDGSNQMVSSGGGGRMESVEAGFESGNEMTQYGFDQMDIWSDISQSLSALKSNDGRFVANISGGSVLLRDYPTNVAMMRQYLEDLNANLSISLVIDIKVVELTRTRQQRRGLNWNVITSDLSASGILEFTSGFRGLMSESAPPMISYTQDAGRYAGSEVFLDVLDANGVSYEVTSRTMHTLNNQPRKAVLGSDTGYLAESGSTATANVGTSANLRGGRVRTGGEFYVMPNVFGEDVFLTMSTKFSTLMNLRPAESGDARIELPETSLDEELGSYRILDGNTLVLTSGIDRSSVNERSIANLCFFGCESSSQSELRERIILITPRIIRGM